MSFALRRATHKDIDAIIELAIESVSKDPLPVRIDRDAMRAMALEGLGPTHFLWVAEVDGKVEGAVGAYVQRGFWFERMQASVLLFYSRVPGAGAALIREFARWVKSRPAIKLAVFSLEHNADPRLGKFLRRLGFTLENPQFTYVRGRT